MHRGYIKIFRKMEASWLWKEKPFGRAQAWIDLLLMANHAPAKVVIENAIYQLTRGQMITSELKLGQRWGWNRHKVRRFLKLLQNDAMIDRKPNNKMTMITVCNYDTYQGHRTTDDTTDAQRAHNERTQTITSKEPINKNQEKEAENRPPSPDLKDEIIELFKNTYLTIRGSQYHVINKAKERGAAGGLLKIFKDIHPNYNADQIKVVMETFFGKACGVRNEWHYNNMTLPHLYSNINPIKTAINQGVGLAKEGKNLATHPPGPPIRDLSKDPTILKMMKERENLGDTNQ